LGEKKLKKTNLTQDEIDALFLKFRKEDVTFEDLVSERDKIVRVIEIHSITIDALKTELTKWDDDVSIAFNKLLDKTSKNSKKSEVNKK
jgi:hypothetical protein